MKINEVASLVGLTPKSIRYYEEEGLIKPNRNKDNAYRQYSEDEIKTLRLIKFLRELNVSIYEIKKVFNKEITLKECMEERIKKITELENNYKTIKNMCKEIANDDLDWEAIDISKYSQVINVLGKRGFTMKDIQKTHKNKILGAVFSSLVFSFLFIFLIILITYFQITEVDKMPLILYIFFMIILGIPVLGIGVNLIKRIKEIRGGEEDEASKY